MKSEPIGKEFNVKALIIPKGNILILRQTIATAKEDGKEYDVSISGKGVMIQSPLQFYNIDFPSIIKEIIEHEKELES